MNVQGSALNSYIPHKYNMILTFHANLSLASGSVIGNFKSWKIPINERQ